MSSKSLKLYHRAGKVKTLQDILYGEQGVNRVIQIGYAPRSKEAKEVDADAAPNTGELSFGNVRPDGSVVYVENASVVYGPHCHDFAIRPGDILFRGRGSFPAAAYVTKDGLNDALRRSESIQQFIYTSALLRIRLVDGTNDAPELDAEYLAAYINSPAARRHFTKHSQGSAIMASVGKRDLMTLPVFLPPLEDQRRIAQLVRVQSEYNEMTQALADKYNSIIQFYFLQLPTN